MTAYQFSICLDRHYEAGFQSGIRSGRLASHKTQNDPPVAWAASAPRINW